MHLRHGDVTHIFESDGHATSILRRERLKHDETRTDTSRISAVRSPWIRGSWHILDRQLQRRLNWSIFLATRRRRNRTARCDESSISSMHSHRSSHSPRSECGVLEELLKNVGHHVLAPGIIGTIMVSHIFLIFSNAISCFECVVYEFVIIVFPF